MHGNIKNPGNVKRSFVNVGYMLIGAIPYFIDHLDDVFDDIKHDRQTRNRLESLTDETLLDRMTSNRRKR